MLVIKGKITAITSKTIPMTVLSSASITKPKINITAETKKAKIIATKQKILTFLLLIIIHSFSTAQALRRLPCAKGAVAQATEGLLHNVINVRAHTVKILPYHLIWYSYYLEIISFQKSSSFAIVCDSRFQKMLRPIQFDHKLRFRTIEIRNVLSQNLLF